jgi:hypothetical protein
LPPVDEVGQGEYQRRRRLLLGLSAGSDVVPGRVCRWPGCDPMVMSVGLCAVHRYRSGR